MVTSGMVFALDVHPPLNPDGSFTTLHALEPDIRYPMPIHLNPQPKRTRSLAPACYVLHVHQSIEDISSATIRYFTFLREATLFQHMA